MKRVHVDEIESLPVLEGQLQWKPVRHTLGVDAFGINAYHADEVGDLVVEEHADPHQELYAVIRGRARFRSGDEEVDAPAGTLLLFEASEHRVAHAAEPDTVVLAVGAEARRFEPSVWEYAFRAYGLWKLGRPDEARRAIAEGLEHYPNNARLQYDLACLESLDGNGDEALALLRQAVDADPQTAEWAREDSDFDLVRDDPRFASAVAGKADPGGSGA
ncbi:MAG: tetratricopeptide repeat protein [Gaiellaceae bacterium]